MRGLDGGACGASCGRPDGWFDVHHRRPVDCLQSVGFNPQPVACHDAGTVQADGFGRLGEQVLNTPVSGWLSRAWQPPVLAVMRLF